MSDFTTSIRFNLMLDQLKQETAQAQKLLDGLKNCKIVPQIDTTAMTKVAQQIKQATSTTSGGGMSGHSAGNYSTINNLTNAVAGNLGQQINAITMIAVKQATQNLSRGGGGGGFGGGGGGGGYGGGLGGLSTEFRALGATGLGRLTRLGGAFGGMGLALGMGGLAVGLGYEVLQQKNSQNAAVNQYNLSTRYGNDATRAQAMSTYTNFQKNNPTFAHPIDFAMTKIMGADTYDNLRGGYFQKQLEAQQDIAENFQYKRNFAQTSNDITSNFHRLNAQSNPFDRTNSAIENARAENFSARAATERWYRDSMEHAGTPEQRMRLGMMADIRDSQSNTALEQSIQNAGKEYLRNDADLIADRQATEVGFHWNASGNKTFLNTSHTASVNARNITQSRELQKIAEDNASMGGYASAAYSDAAANYRAKNQLSDAEFNSHMAGLQTHTGWVSRISSERAAGHDNAAAIDEATAGLKTQLSMMGPGDERAPLLQKQITDIASSMRREQAFRQSQSSFGIGEQIATQKLDNQNKPYSAAIESIYASTAGKIAGYREQGADADKYRNQIAELGIQQMKGIQNQVYNANPTGGLGMLGMTVDPYRYRGNPDDFSGLMNKYTGNLKSYESGKMTADQLEKSGGGGFSGSGSFGDAVAGMATDIKTIAEAIKNSIGTGS